MEPIDNGFEWKIETVASLLMQQGLLVSERVEHSRKGKLGVLRTDSRLVTPGDIFLAYKGVNTDGHDFLQAALDRGASLLIGDEASPEIPKSASWIQVKDSRVAWSFLAAAANGNPQEKLKLIGITGTNGKTSTVWMIGELLRAAGRRCLTIGTLGAYFGEDRVPTSHTTPDPDLLFSLLARAVATGYTVVAMEASSHAIALGKLAPIRFAATAFTSFSRDHLDFHKTLDDYLATKLRLFSEFVKPEALQVFAASLPRPMNIAGFPGTHATYGVSSDTLASEPNHHLRISIKSADFSGTEVSLLYGDRLSTGKIPYFSTHAVENFAAALLISSHVAGKWLEPDLWPAMRPVPGRLDTIRIASRPSVVVDYAHTPDALEKTLQVLRPICHGRLLLVFGCGGDRDKGKRPLMGAIAERLADEVFITSDNPRKEHPAAIIADILAGAKRPDLFHVEPDRSVAIAQAIAKASPKDLVLIAGKGHETTQIFADSQVEFDDRLVARSCLNSRA